MKVTIIIDHHPSNKSNFKCTYHQHFPISMISFFFLLSYLEFCSCFQFLQIGFQNRLQHISGGLVSSSRTFVPLHQISASSCSGQRSALFTPVVAACRSSSALCASNVENTIDTPTEPDSNKDSMLVENRDDVGKSILSLAIPALLALSIDPLMTLVDTIFVGRYPGSEASSSEALAGMGSASALLTLAFYVMNFLATATAPLVGRKRSEGDENGAISTASRALSLSMLLGLALAVILIFCGPTVLLDAMGADYTGPAGREAAEDFVIVRAFAAPAVLVSGAASGVLRGFLDTLTPTIVLTLANVVNLCLDVLLVQYLGMGTTGAALATTTAECVCAGSYLLILAGIIPLPSEVWRGDDKSEDNDHNANMKLPRMIPSLSVPSWSEFQPLLTASSAIFLRSAAIQLSLVTAAATVARDTLSYTSSSDAVMITSAAVAAHQIALQLWMLCSFITDSLAAASQALIADAIGQRSPTAVRNISLTVFQYGAVLGMVLGAILAFGAYGPSHVLIGLFTSDETTQELLFTVMGLVVVAQPVNALVFVGDGVLQGASEFVYQAKTMVLSSGVAMTTFFCDTDF
uniref:Protein DETOXIFICATION n=1 Tax=Corethron hystrix TaxID=216773 RepID=A0A7S1BDZ0_9STRA|mmetsp:Transcript_23921/g.54443  ORF Transcript_23921/g.54443 Transcript_23921/m.54443 type:complete len:577 (+) Transcript_23921:234-1964(+)